MPTAETERCAIDAASFMDERRDDSPWSCGPHAVRKGSTAAVRPHDIEAIPNSGGGTTHYCRLCGDMGVGLAPTLPCPGLPEVENR